MECTTEQLNVRSPSTVVVTHLSSAQICPQFVPCRESYDATQKVLLSFGVVRQNKTSRCGPAIYCGPALFLSPPSATNLLPTDMSYSCKSRYTLRCAESLDLWQTITLKGSLATVLSCGGRLSTNYGSRKSLDWFEGVVILERMNEVFVHCRRDVSSWYYAEE
ncbi:hypothetical protein BaRGS_00020787, partial [Batillaria attramentaria]